MKSKSSRANKAHKSRATSRRCAVSLGSAVDLRKLAEAIAYIQAVNRLPLNEITWTRDNVVVHVTAAQIDDWRFTGLNNRDFAREHLLPNQ